MYQIIDGKAIAEEIKNEIVKEIVKLKNKRPNLAIILVGERSDSQLYVSLKEKEGKKLGIDMHVYKIENDVSEKDLLEIIEFLNKDELIDGILIQLPLPKHLDVNKIIHAINPLKDVDGFHCQKPDYIVSPVLASIKACLENIKFSSPGKRACVFYNSDIFGHNVEQLLLKEGFKVINSSDSKQADLIISALGSPEKIKKNIVKKNAVIIDIGITKIKDKVKGDADVESLKNHISYLTPVPGGIGPMTIAFLFKNVLEIFKKRLINEK